MVVVSMGELAGDTNFSFSSFDNIFWKKLDYLIN